MNLKKTQTKILKIIYKYIKNPSIKKLHQFFDKFKYLVYNKL